MNDPVVAVNGITYERKAIMEKEKNLDHICIIQICLQKRGLGQKSTQLKMN